MKFGRVSLDKAAGCILAHSVHIGDLRLKKGVTLGAGDIEKLAQAGRRDIIVACLDADDVGEDAAATRIVRALVPDPVESGLQVHAAFAGRVNLYAERPGLLQVDAGAIARLNAIDPAITLATLPDMKRVPARAMIATVKIIPYGVARESVERVVAKGDSPLRVLPFTMRRASLVLSETEGMNPTLIAKGRRAVESRLTSLGMTLEEVQTVPHTTAALTQAIKDASGEMILVLTASATSDAQDVGPQALRDAGGQVTRFGMPVDPGNLLFLGHLQGRPVIGLPGCVRSPALNGADWVLERIACGLTVTDAEIAGMGVGGLLKEIPTRPQPRAGLPDLPRHPNVEVLMLAAGASRRMRGKDKLLEPVGEIPVLRHAAMAALAAGVRKVHVVLSPDSDARKDALQGLEVDAIEAPDWSEGMAASVRAGLAGVATDCDAVIVAFADMPDVTGPDFDALIAAFDPLEGREICRAVSETGKPGHPVLFGRRFFESLAGLAGDRGARDIVLDGAEYLVDVRTSGEGATTDLDTPEDWARWRTLAKN